MARRAEDDCARGASNSDAAGMKKFVRWIIWIPVGAAVVIFLIANRAPVALSFDPFSSSSPAAATPAMPLWLWLVLALFIGFLLGAFGMWASDRELRIRAKADRLELMALKRAAGKAADGEPQS